MTDTPAHVPWWRDAVVYQVYVRSFTDSDGDGMGDLPGVTSRLRYLKDLGVDAVWLNPFYPSPQHDAGYDVADYCDVDPRFGTLADFDALVERAHSLGLKVIADIVPNHTSSDHPWFQAALAAEPGSPERDRYLFRNGKGRGGSKPPNSWLSVFGGQGWSRVDDGQWYLHLFDATQPDLNWRNPEVWAMFRDVLRFWLDRGVDGFRVDVAHGLVKDARLRDPRTLDDEPMWDQPGVHDVYRDWHAVLADYDGDRMMVAEAWTPTQEARARYIRPDEFQQAFNFDWLQATWSASVFADVIEMTLASVGSVGATPTWVLSNHDVVRHVTRYGGGPVGLARARAATLTMLALPGSSYLYQGEEVGLPEAEVAPEDRQDPAWFRSGVVGRDGCRVPIPWRGSRPPYGFGPAGSTPWLPQPPEWADLTVATERKTPGSTWQLYRDALRLRRRFTDAGSSVSLVRDRATVLQFSRGPLTVVCNCGPRPVRLPPGDVLISSGPLDGHLLPPDTAVWVG